MSTTSDFEYLKYMALNAAENSGKSNLKEAVFPTEIRPNALYRIVKKIGSLIASFFRLIANSIKETPAEYNARISRYHDEPRVRGLLR